MRQLRLFTLTMCGLLCAAALARAHDMAFRGPPPGAMPYPPGAMGPGAMGPGAMGYGPPPGAMMQGPYPGMPPVYGGAGPDCGCGGPFGAGIC